MKVRVVLSCLALLFGAFIVWLSLSASVQIASADNVSASQKRLYFNREVLPDHVFYPVLMAIDRSRLEAAHPVEKIYLQIEYANRRLFYAAELLETGKSDLALTTLTKAEKYMLQAAREAQSSETPLEVRQFASKALEVHIRETIAMKNSFSDEQRVVLDPLLVEANQLLVALQSE